MQLSPATLISAHSLSTHHSLLHCVITPLDEDQRDRRGIIRVQIQEKLEKGKLLMGGMLLDLLLPGSDLEPGWVIGG